MAEASKWTTSNLVLIPNRTRMQLALQYVHSQFDIDLIVLCCVSFECNRNILLLMKITTHLIFFRKCISLIEIFNLDGERERENARVIEFQIDLQSVTMDFMDFHFWRTHSPLNWNCTCGPFQRDEIYGRFFMVKSLDGLLPRLQSHFSHNVNENQWANKV